MRNETLRNAKAELRRWFARHDDDYIIRVLEHCRNGTFRYSSHCHCIRGLRVEGYSYQPDESRPAEVAVNQLGVFADRYQYWVQGFDKLRILRLIPMLLREIRSRNAVPQVAEPKVMA